MSLQVCSCGWSKITTYHGLRTHQGKNGCTPKGMRIPECEQFRFNSRVPQMTFLGPPIKIAEDLISSFAKPGQWFTPDSWESRSIASTPVNRELLTMSLTFGTPENPTPLTLSTATNPVPLTFGTPANQAPLTFGTPANQAPMTFGKPANLAPLTFSTPANLAPLTFSTPANPAPLTFGTPANPAPLTVGSPANPAPMTFDTPANPAPLTFSTPANPAPLAFGKPANPAPLTFCTPANPAPLTFSTPANPAPLTFGKLVNPAPLTFGTPANPAPLTIGTPANPAPMTFDTPASLEPLTFSTPANPAPLTFGTPANPAPLTFRTPANLVPLTFSTPANPAPLTFDTPASPEPLTFSTPANPAPLTFGTPANPAPLTFGTPANLAPLTFSTPANPAPLTFGMPANPAPLTFSTPANPAPLTFGTLANPAPLTFSTPASPAAAEVLTEATNQPSFQTPPPVFDPTTRARRTLHFCTGATQLQNKGLWAQTQQKDTERERKERQLAKERHDRIRADLLLKIEMIEQKMDEVKLSSKECKVGLDTEWLEINNVFSGVMKDVEEARHKALQPLEERRHRVKKETQDLVKKLKKETDKLKEAIEELDQNQDLQIFPLTDLDDSWKTVTVDTSFSFGTLTTTTSNMIKNIQKKLEQLSSTELKRTSKFAVDVKLDPVTAHPFLKLSPDGKKVSEGGKDQGVPPSSKRFDMFGSVMGLNRFTSGKSYWEVEVKNKSGWDLGVARGDANRKGKLFLTPDNGYWVTVHYEDEKYAAMSTPPASLALTEKPQKVGVFVDYEQGLVSFYDVIAKSHIYSFTGCLFNGEIRPYFSPHLKQNHKNSAPLMISPVN